MIRPFLALLLLLPSACGPDQVAENAAVPPLEAPVEVPNEIIGGTLPEQDGLQQDDLIPEGQPLPPPTQVTPPPGVGLF